MSRPDHDADSVGPAMRALLSARPPDHAIRWVERVTGGAVARVVRLRGGSSSAMHAVTVRSSAGATARFVLRRYVRSDVTAGQPDIADREVRTLHLVEKVGPVTPAVVACDLDGDDVGVAAILMTVVPGRPNAIEPGRGAWRRLAETAVAIQAAPIGRGDGVQAFFGYEPRRSTPPPWMGDARLWDRALTIFRDSGGRREGGVFLHRDFHTGNVLWRRGQLTGVVDWQSASIGPASVDVAYMRLGLLDRYGPEAATDFLRLAKDVSGLVNDPWVDVVLLVDGLGGADDLPPRFHDELEGILASALAELDAS